MHVICSPSEYLEDYALAAGFNYDAIPINRSISVLDDLKAIWRTFKYIRKNKIDIVVGHTPKGGMVAMLAARMAGVKTRIYFRHGLVYETSEGTLRKLLIAIDRLTSWCATKVVCVSPSVLKRSIDDHLGGVRKQTILRQGSCNGIDTQSKFNPDNLDKNKLDTLRESLGLTDDNYVIGYTGRLVRDKGIAELVEAFEKLKDAGNCRLLLVGMFEQRDSLSEDIKQRIIGNPNIIYTGFVNEDMEYYYGLMDMYILPSYREGLPTGVLEAQSMELPVVTTQVTGCIDSIVNGKTGIFTTHEVGDIIDSIDKIRINHAINGKNGRQWICENFTNQLIWHEIEKLY